MSASEKGAELVDFVVDRNDLRHSQFVHTPGPPALAPDQALLRVDQFAFTANNVTYAVAGDMMSYWNFFPAAPGWGRVPVWGFADVLRSSHPGIAVGERVFGYFPMSTHVVLHPDHLHRGGFTDATRHRAPRHVAYHP